VVPHSNHVKILDIAESKTVVGEQDIKWSGLPFVSGFINQNKELILGGYDKKVARFVKKGNTYNIQATSYLKVILIKMKRPIRLRLKEALWLI
jgi:hypothetical protein